MRIAVYARYSTDNQNAKSTQDQIRECQEYIEKKFTNVTLVEKYSDSAISGQYSHHRKQYLKLLEAIRQNRLDVVVAEGLDRLSRNLGDISQLYQIAQFRNTRIYTLLEGEIDPLHIGFKGTMNAMYTSSIRQQVKRSHRSRILEGKSFGLPYGYKIKLENGREVTGERDIDPQKAKVITQVFSMYAEGHSLGSIVHYLNAHKIPSPTNKMWGKNSLMGSKSRKEGILNNEIYHGKLIWNMKSLRTNPETGKKNYVINPIEDWVISEREDLRIISNELWDRCEALKNRSKSSKPKVSRLINPLRELVYCGACGAHKTIANKDRYVCSNYRKYRVCSNARGTKKSDILKASFARLHSSLDTFCAKGKFESFRLEIHREEIIQELKETNSIISELVNFIDKKDMDIDELTTKLNDLNNRRFELEQALNKHQYTSVNTEIEKCLRSTLSQLEKDLQEKQHNDNNRLLYKSLISSIKLTPNNQKRGEKISIRLRPHCWQVFLQLIENQNA